MFLRLSNDDQDLFGFYLTHYPSGEKWDYRLKRAMSEKGISPSKTETSEQEDFIAKATAQIFLSYAREDEEEVERLYQKLSEAGFKPWVDTKDILPGEIWQTSIQKAIRRSDFFLVCLSAKSAKRGWIQREIKQALNIWQEKLDSDIYLIPVRLEDCPAPERLSKFQWVDLFEKDDWTRLVKAIQVGMERRAGEEPKPEDEPEPGEEKEGMPESLKGHPLLKFARVVARMELHPPSVFADGASDLLKLKCFSRITKALNFKAIFILVDGVDGYPETKSLQGIEDLLKHLFGTLSLVSMPDIYFKFFLPLEVEDRLIKHRGVETGRIRVSKFTWTEEELLELLRLRLEMASEGKFDSLMAITEYPFNQKIDKALVRVAAGSPRNLLLLGEEIIRVHARS